MTPLVRANGNGTGRNVYHTSADCAHVANSDLRPATDEELERLTHCQWCAGDTNGGGNPSFDHQRALKRAARGESDD